MSITFYVIMGFLIGVAVMCGMVIAVSVSDRERREFKEDRSPSKPDAVVFKSPKKDHYTYDSSGRKRKVKNVSYRDS